MQKPHVIEQRLDVSMNTFVVKKKLLIFTDTGTNNQILLCRFFDTTRAQEASEHTDILAISP